MPPKKTAPATQPEMKYPELVCQPCVGKDAITADTAKEWLGWTEGTEEKPLEEYQFVDELGHKIYCLFNTLNRPIMMVWCRTLAQVILRGFWRLNGETIIIGKTGQVLSGQHRLVALVIAVQLWNSEDKAERDHWRKIWPTEPTLESFVTFGVEETEDFRQTHDNTRPRSFADVLFANEDFKKKYKSTGERKVATRAAEFAIRLLWQRVGQRADAYAPLFSGPDAMDFLTRHPKLTRFLKHVIDENGDSQKRITRYVSLGTAAGLTYLMASCLSGTAKYKKSAGDKALDWSLADKAEEFWVMLASSPDFDQVRHALGRLDSEDGTKGSVREKVAVLVKAWNEWSSDGALIEETLKLKYREDAHGNQVFTENVTLGGIDLGDGTRTDPATDPTPEQIEAEKAKLDAEKAPKPEPAEKPKKGGKKPAPEPEPAPAEDELPDEPAGAVSEEDDPDAVAEEPPAPVPTGRPSDAFAATAAKGTAEVHARNGTPAPKKVPTSPSERAKLRGGVN